jgi:hypothetical protein
MQENEIFYPVYVYILDRGPCTFKIYCNHGNNYGIGSRNNFDIEIIPLF